MDVFISSWDNRSISQAEITDKQNRAGILGKVPAVTGKDKQLEYSSVRPPEMKLDIYRKTRLIQGYLEKPSLKGSKQKNYNNLDKTGVESHTGCGDFFCDCLRHGLVWPDRDKQYPHFRLGVE